MVCITISLNLYDRVKNARNTKYVEIQPLMSATGKAVYKIEHVLCLPYHQQVNFAERAIKTLKLMVAIFVYQDHRNWNKYLYEFRQTMNTTIQVSKKVSPAFSNFGREPQQAKSLQREVEAQIPIIYSSIKDWSERIARLDALRDLVIKHIEEAQTRQLKHYDRKQRQAEFSVGNLVLRHAHTLSSASTGRNAKLDPRFSGPYKVLQVISLGIYILTTENKKQVPMAHISELKRYVSPPNVNKNS
ncbi:uncharacterized protein LOC131667530 [Phymastichus coffea]|uniref:uncharacterized protein LOC131667530 n=1 Tax=Phymastichus coffea TaxID=108790 RepID=UPI00273AC61F|nr:uncharacterized protein LOC131667530 [Phymastichus coffea]